MSHNPDQAFEHFLDSGPGPTIIIDGQPYLYFGGTGYYGLQTHPKLIGAAIDALTRYGMHAATTRGLYGNTRLYRDVETKAAEFFGTEAAVYLPSGYLCNLAAFQGLFSAAPFDVALIDESAHFSAADVLPILRTPIVKFAHCDADDLHRKLTSHLRHGQRGLIISDGVFPLMGRIAPIPEYVEASTSFDVTFWIDDAHAIGVLGDRGRGTYDHYGLRSDRLLFGGTLSKAFGAYGGIIPGSNELIQLIRAGHVMTAATACPSSAAAAALAGFELLMCDPEMRDQLRRNVRQLKTGLRDLGLPIDTSPVPVAAWMLESSAAMDCIHAALMRHGICIQRARYIGGNSAGVLRVVVFSTHTPEQIRRLIGELGALL